MMSEKIIKIKDDFIQEALDYARLSKNHLSNQHSFHKGSLDDKEHKVPELEFPLKIETNSSNFEDAIEDAGIVADSVSFVADDLVYISFSRNSIT